MSISDKKNIIIRKNKTPVDERFKRTYNSDFRIKLIQSNNVDFLRKLLFICLDPPNKSFLRSNLNTNFTFIMPLFRIFSSNVSQEIDFYMTNFIKEFFILNFKKDGLYIPRVLTRYLDDISGDIIELIKFLYYYYPVKNYSLLQLLNKIKSGDMAIN